MRRRRRKIKAKEVHAAPTFYRTTAWLGPGTVRTSLDAPPDRHSRIDALMPRRRRLVGPSIATAALYGQDGDIPFASGAGDVIAAAAMGLHDG